jgi:cytochrome b6-f complex iron-sulfur subunit
VAETEEPGTAPEAAPPPATPVARAVAAPPVVTPVAARAIVVDTPVAKPVARREVITRRIFLLGGFWSALGLAFVGILGSPLDFMWPRNLKGFGGPITVTPDLVPAEGADPIHIFDGKFWLLNRKAGPSISGDDSPGGLIALYHKCPHLGCTVPWRPDFTFDNRKGWFRCPCHGSTYTKDGGVKVFGPAPRPLDVFPITVNPDKSLTVLTGRTYEGTGNSHNPARTIPYTPGSKTPPKIV